MNIREAASKAGVTDMTVRRWIKTGKLEAQKMPGKAGEVYFIAPEALDALLGGSSRENVDSHGSNAGDSAAVLAERVAGLQAMLEVLQKQVEEKDNAIKSLLNTNTRLSQQNADLQTLALPSRKDDADKRGFWSRMFKRSDS